MISFGFAPIRSATCLRALLDRFLGLPSERMVAARRVAELLGEVRHHRLEHPRIDGRRGVIVHVDRKLHRCSSAGPLRRDPPYVERCVQTAARETGTGDETFSAAISAIVTVPSAADNPLANLPERIADAALAELLAVMFVRRARGHGERPVDRLDHVGHADAGRRTAQHVAAARSLRRGEQAASGPAAAAPWPSARSGCRTAPRFRARWSTSRRASERRCFIAISA